MSRRLVQVLSGTLFVFLLAVPFPGTLAQSPVRIGVLYPLTGHGASVGKPALLGHEVAVDMINAQGGLLGWRVESVVRDTKLNPAEATAVARELVTKDNVNFLVGVVSSAVGQAVSEVARQEGIIFIATVAMSTKITDAENRHPYVFRTAANTNTEGKSAAVVADRVGMDRICTILMDYSYGHSLSEAFLEHIEAIRPEAEVVLQLWPEQGTTDYITYITQLMQTRCDGVFSGVWLAFFPSFAKHAKTLGLFRQKKFVSAGSVGATELARQMGDDLPTGIWGNSYELSYHPMNEQHQKYIAQMRERTGERYPPSFPITGFIGMQMLAEGVRKAGTTETRRVIQALEGLTVRTPTGELTIRSLDHQADRGQFWGRVSENPGYPFKILNPVSYIPAGPLID